MYLCLILIGNYSYHLCLINLSKSQQFKTTTIYGYLQFYHVGQAQLDGSVGLECLRWLLHSSMRCLHRDGWNSLRLARPLSPHDLFTWLAGLPHNSWRNSNGKEAEAASPPKGNRWIYHKNTFAKHFTRPAQIQKGKKQTLFLDLKIALHVQELATASLHMAQN